MRAASPVQALEDADFDVLNALEDLEVRRINFGIVEAWTGSRNSLTVVALIGSQWPGTWTVWR